MSNSNLAYEPETHHTQKLNDHVSSKKDHDNLTDWHSFWSFASSLVVGAKAFEALPDSHVSALRAGDHMRMHGL